MKRAREYSPGLLLQWLIFTAGTFAATLALGGVTLTTAEVIDEIAAPAVSAANTAKLYVDSTAHRLRMSLNTGAFFDVLTSNIGCALTGCTMTGQMVFSGVTTDITTGTNEDMTIVTNGTGNVVLAGGTTGYVQVNSSQANYQLWVAGQSANAGLRIYPDNTANNAFGYFDQDITHHKIAFGWAGSGADADYASNGVWYAYAGAPNHLIVSGDVGAAGTNLLTVKANVDATGATVFSVDGVGNVVVASTATHTKASCTLVSGTPSTCTATVSSGCLPICGYGALGVGSIAPSSPVYCTVSGTTLTATGGNTSVNIVNFWCP